MSTVVPRYLNDLPLLRDLNDAEVEHVSRFAVRRLLERETLLQTQGEPVQFLGFLLSGRGTESLGGQGGRTAVVRRLRGGTMFGQRALIVDEPSPFVVSCAAGTELLMISVPAFRDLLPHSPRLGAALSRALVDRETELRRRMEVLLVPKGEDRVAAYLALVAEQMPGITTATLKAQGLTHEQIANECGLSRETVSRIMTRRRESKS